jgi:hypothetical protein
MSAEDDAYTQGGRHALMRAARFMRKAEKNRSFAWLKECADRWEQGFEVEWPDAPAYRGAVVHVDAPEPDLRELTAEQLDRLRTLVRLECDRRGPEGM